MAEKLDKTNQKLLYYLELDANTPYNKLAKKLGISPEAVAYRVNKLTKDGVIVRRHAIVDMSKLGYETYRVYIKWQGMTLADKEKFYEFMQTMSAVWTIAKLHGKWDVAFFVGVKHSSDFQKVWRAVESVYKSNVAEYKIAIYSPIHNFNKKFFCDELDFSIDRASGGNVAGDYDEVDEQILVEYGKDTRQSLHDIAIKVGKSIETVRQRIARLELDKVIVGYKLDIDLAKLGFQGYRVDFYLNSTTRKKELVEYMRHHRYFYQVNDSIGGADFECEIVVSSLVHLLEELEIITKQFKDVIRYYEYFGYTGFPVLSMVAD